MAQSNQLSFDDDFVANRDPVMDFLLVGQDPDNKWRVGRASSSPHMVHGRWRGKATDSLRLKFYRTSAKFSTKEGAIDWAHDYQDRLEAQCFIVPPLLIQEQRVQPARAINRRKRVG